MKIILASASPRRREILEKHDIQAVIIPTDVCEDLPEGIGMIEAVKTLAERKARSCFDIIRQDAELSARYEGHVIIGSDTIVWKDEIMGKPISEEDAIRMLHAIRDTSHYVVTGVCLIDVNSGDSAVISDITTVWCKDYSDEDIAEYLSHEDLYDKAGSYAIQGYFGRYIDHIDGDYENVVGLPYYRIEGSLKKYML